MDRTRIDRDVTEPDDRTPALDRAWALTRPAELSADEFDRIWAEVLRAHDARPATLTMSPTPRSRRRAFALVVFGLTQAAAAALVAAWAFHRPVVVDRPPVVRADPPEVKVPVVVDRYDVEVDETLVINLDDGRMIDRRLYAPPGSESLAMRDLPEHTAFGLLNSMEAQSR